MFIDSTYFVGEINIPTRPAADTSLTQAITQYEKEILIQLLGYKLYSLLVADCTDGVPATQIYKDLVNGKEFDHEFNGEIMTLKWEGLKGANNISLIAFYIYYCYVERDSSRYTGTGVSMTPAGEGFQRVSPEGKLINAWNRMRDLYGVIPPEYKCYFPGPIKGINLPGVFTPDPSAYNFLYANKDSYPDWYFTAQWNINQFGI